MAARLHIGCRMHIRNEWAVRFKVRWRLAHRPRSFAMVSKATLIDANLRLAISMA
jgi:hypothetical protein